MKKLLLSIAATIILFMTAQTFAQAPQSFKYQAVARDNSGNVLASKNVSFKISILKTSTTGNAVYCETQTATTNQFGLANLSLGGGTVVSGSFSIINWGNDLYFVKIEFDPSGGSNYQFMGTSQLLSVPYALHAKTADNGFSGNYNDLTNKPTIPTIPTNVSSFSNDAHYLTTEQQALRLGHDTIYLTNGGFVKIPTGFSGAYEDLTGKPVLSAGTGIEISGNTISSLNSNPIWNANQLLGTTIRNATLHNGDVLKCFPIDDFGTKTWYPAASQNYSPSLNFPDGLDNLMPITLDNLNTTPFVVPTGKNLYITNFYDFTRVSYGCLGCGDEIYIDNKIIVKFEGNYEHNSILFPIIAGAGQQVKIIGDLDNGDLSLINGFLVPSNVSPVTIEIGTAGYIASNTLVLLNYYSNWDYNDALKINGKIIYLGYSNVGPTGTPYGLRSPLLIKAGDVISTISGNSGVINGYIKN